MTEAPTQVRTVLLSHSIDNVFDYCPRKFEFLNIFEKRPPRDSGFAAQVGTALHEGLQEWLISRANGLDAQRCRERAYFRLLMFYPWDEEYEQPASHRSFDKVILALYRLINAPVWNEWDLVKVGDKWAVEVPFLIRHASVGVFQLKQTGEWIQLATQGKIDFILRHRLTGKIKTMDLKTTILGAHVVRGEYTFSGQQVGYSNVLNAMLGVTVDKVEYDYLICRFSVDEEPEVQLLPVVKHADQIEDYWLTKLDRLDRIKGYAEAGWFPRTNGGCHSWGRECSMLDICHSRDYDLIKDWFRAIEAVDQTGYDYWVTLDI